MYISIQKEISVPDKPLLIKLATHACIHIPLLTVQLCSCFFFRSLIRSAAAFWMLRCDKPMMQRSSSDADDDDDRRKGEGGGIGV